MNSVTLTGTIVGNITTREFGVGETAKVKARFLIAVRRPGRGTKPDLIPVETWGNQATNLVRFNGDRSRISVSGRLRGEFFNPDGKERGGRLQLVVVADRIEYLSPPKAEGSTDPAVPTPPAPTARKS